MASESVCARVTSSSSDSPEASEPARWTTDEPCFDLADQAELLGAFTQQEPGHGVVLAVAFADPVPDRSSSIIASWTSAGGRHPRSGEG
jgi:hypothetical protein